ncbi:MAG: tyrosine-type recombinase/integrase [Shewanella sp.]|uniref:tyrosine-type recombinase/integrase n=1 Tax=Shewanella sp. TaxID=50422 RepID=UPI003F3A6A51
MRKATVAHALPSPSPLHPHTPIAYAGGPLVQHLEPLPTSAYIAYLSTLSAGSLPIVRSTLERISQLVFGLPAATAPWQLLTATQFNLMLRHYAQAGLAPKTLHRYACFVRSVLKRAFLLRMIPSAQLAEYETILHAGAVVKGSQGRGQIAPHRSLNDAEIGQLLRVSAADSRPSGRRDLAILALMRGCGLRRAEVAQLHYEHIRWSAGDGGEVLVLHGKGRKARTLPLPRGLREILLRWCTLRGDELGVLFCAINRGQNLMRYSALDVSKQRAKPQQQGQYRPLDCGSINRLMTKRIAQAAIEQATPHDLRYTFAQKTLLRSDLPTVADLLGHANIATTSIYTTTSQDKMRRVVASEDVFDRL